MESDNFADSVTWSSPQAIFAPILKDQLNGGCQIFTALLDGASLSVCARNFGRPADKPVTIALYHGCEFVVHREIIVHLGESGSSTQLEQALGAVLRSPTR